MAKTESKHFRAIARENNVARGEIWVSFWLGEFERGGETKLKYEGLAATRDGGHGS